jgi:polyhydroxyalkanoate synthesis repressor PhaR
LNDGRIIKKYKNRRLYDLNLSQYIKGDDLKRYVVEGILFTVVDAKTQDDITNVTLLQIFVEMEAGSLPFLSTQMLRQLIVLAQHPLNRSFKLLLEQQMLTMQSYLENNSYVSDYHDLTKAWNTPTQSMLTAWKNLFKPLA